VRVKFGSSDKSLLTKITILSELRESDTQQADEFKVLCLTVNSDKVKKEKGRSIHSKNFLIFNKKF